MLTSELYNSVSEKLAVQLANCVHHCIQENDTVSVTSKVLKVYQILQEEPRLLHLIYQSQKDIKEACQFVETFQQWLRNCPQALYDIYTNIEHLPHPVEELFWTTITYPVLEKYILKSEHFNNHVCKNYSFNSLRVLEYSFQHPDSKVTGLLLQQENYLNFIREKFGFRKENNSQITKVSSNFALYEFNKLLYCPHEHFPVLFNSSCMF